MLFEPTEQWFVTLHVTAQGGNSQRVFCSETVLTAVNQITLIPFPKNTVYPLGRDSYSMQAIAAQYNDGLKAYPNTIGIILKIVGGVGPVIRIVDTGISPTWIIGARDIVLTDPPIMTDIPEGVVEQEVASVFK